MRIGAVSRRSDDHGSQCLRLNTDVNGHRSRPILCDRSPAALPSHVAWLSDRHWRRLGHVRGSDSAAGCLPERRCQGDQWCRRTQLQ